MKDSLDTPVISRGNESDVFANRRLIRPTLRRTEAPRPENGERRERAERTERPANGKKIAPPEQTHAENFYYQKQMQSKTPMVIVLQDDEEVHGVIEWYDKYCLKVNREGEPNLLIYKPSIKYMYKENEEGDGK
jgi:sRNA-binding regulator protein Hfq